MDKALSVIDFTRADMEDIVFFSDETSFIKKSVLLFLEEIIPTIIAEII